MEKSLKEYYENGFDTQLVISLKELSQPIDYAYHYTTIDCFQNIVENKKLYATRFDCLNDPKERKDILDVLRNVFETYKNVPMFYNQLK